MAEQPPPEPVVAEPEDWLPPLVLFADHGNSWQRYIDAVYAVFRTDFVGSQPKLNGRWIRCRRDPIYDGKEAAFWHCVSEGKTEEERLPDIRRCERICWLRAVIEHSTDKRVDVWRTDRRGDLRHYLWFAEEYLIALGDRGSYLILITAFCTNREHYRRKLRAERDTCRKDGG